MTAVLEPEFRRVLNSADVAAPDGMPLAWSLRSFGVRGQPRVYGPDVMLELCRQAGRFGHRLFFYGGREETLPVLCGQLETRFPRLCIVGAYAPPFRPLTREEDEACVRTILGSEADIVFVGIGAPKQERWIAEHRNRLRGVILVGVGAAFDFLAGRIRQAPRWMQQAGLEWLFRLMMEPRRLWKRYLLFNPLFVAMLALQKAGILRYAPCRPGRNL
jgi:N-acetylglucosaminyldiphosphoundecaprenol N-acetyl-beta-D-mannosaminyltransferase